MIARCEFLEGDGELDPFTSLTLLGDSKLLTLPSFYICLGESTFPFKLGSWTPEEFPIAAFEVYE